MTSFLELFFFRESILPAGFSLPTTYEQMIVSGEMPSIAPWEFLCMDMARSLSYYGDMLLKFPNSPLIPFSIILDPSEPGDDGYVILACFDGSDLSGDPKVRIYDYGRPQISPWEGISYPNFLAWLEDAKKSSQINELEEIS